MRVKVGVKLFSCGTRFCLIAWILAQIILLAFQDLDVEILVIRADKCSLKLDVLVAKTDKVLNVSLECSRLALVFGEVEAFLAMSPLLRKFCEDDPVP